MQVVDTNRSRACFNRLKEQTREGRKQKRSRADRKGSEAEKKRKAGTKRNKEINCKGLKVESFLCSCQGRVKALFLRKERAEGKQPEQFPVAMTERSHLFPSRTQKLSSPVPKVLGWTRPGRIGRCRIPFEASRTRCFFFAFGLAAYARSWMEWGRAKTSSY